MKDLTVEPVVLQCIIFNDKLSDLEKTKNILLPLKVTFNDIL